METDMGAAGDAETHRRQVDCITAFRGDKSAGIGGC
jgi:hypothetical protein